MGAWPHQPVGIKLGFDQGCRTRTKPTHRQRALHVAGHTERTFDIDFVDPAYAPGTGTPEVGGFTSYESLNLVRSIKDLNFVGFDIVEVLPAYDTAGETTAYLAANIVFEYLSILAAKKQAK